MLFAVIFEDDPGADSDIRRANMPAHLEFLETNASSIDAAGPLSTPEGDAAGGLWLVRAPDEHNVDALVKQDPFWSTGLRKSVQILKWTQVYAGGTRLV